jgi:hypothetical protein
LPVPPRLRAVDLQRGSQLTRHRERAHRLRSAAYGNHDGIETAGLVEHLEAHRRRSGDDAQIVRGVRNGHVLLARHAQHHLDGLVVVSAFFDDGGAPSAHRRVLFRVIPHRNADRGSYVQE